MSFFRNLLDEAGRKTGSAIGNRLFPKYTDYIRLGSTPGTDDEDRLEEERESAKERLDMQQQANIQQSLLRFQFDAYDLDHNIAVLTHIAAIIDSLPSWPGWRSEYEDRTLKMAKSLMRSGIEISKRIDSSNPIIAQFDSKY